MKALLLAGGLGTRLKPITNTIPKCLVPINGKPLLQYWLENLSNVGVKEFLINTSYLSEQVEEFVKGFSDIYNITLSHEKKLLDTGGTLLANEWFFSDEAFFLVHADNLSFCDFKKFITAHVNRPENCEITMMLFYSDNPSSCGIVEIDDNGIVQKFYEKVENPHTNLANGAVYICEPSIFQYLKELEKENIDFSLEVLPAFMGKINTFVNNKYHRDIGMIENFAIAQIEVLDYLK